MISQTEVLISLFLYFGIVDACWKHPTDRRCQFEGQIWKECPRYCFNPYCFGLPYACPPPPYEPYCEPGCECPDGYLLGYNDRCVPEERCPDCPEGEVWVGGNGIQTTEICHEERTCDRPNPYPLSALLVPECISMMGGSCECPQDKFRGPNGNCIDYEDCPNSPCPYEGQIWKPCAGYCFNPYCFGVMYVCPPPPYEPYCVAKCECPRGHLLGYSDRCVPVENCPDCPSGEVWIGGNGIFAEDVCQTERTCDNPNPDLKCTSMLGGRCVCPQDKVRGPDGNCIDFEGCFENVCPFKGQIWKSCTRYCFNPYCNGLPYDCPAPPHEPFCEPGCECPDGQLLTVQSSECVPERHCPTLSDERFPEAIDRDDYDIQ